MPSFSLIKPLGWAVFMSKGHKLPTKADWKQPSGDPAGNQYRDGIKAENWVAVPQGLPLFTPQNPHKYHMDSCNTLGKQYKAFHDTMLDAVQFGHNLWRLQAKISGLIINGPVAVGKPGCLQGPELKNLIKTYPACILMMGNEGKFTVPGLPWYPAFAAFPGPQAPPMPNIPTPLSACISAQAAMMLMPNNLKKEMINALPQGLRDKDHDKHYETLFESIATAVSAGFAIWINAQMVMNVLGRGPIPTFAPPYVPVGPVVGGGNIAIPGHLAV